MESTAALDAEGGKRAMVVIGTLLLEGRVFFVTLEGVLFASFLNPSATKHDVIRDLSWRKQSKRPWKSGAAR